MPHETTAWQCNFCHRCFIRKVDACNHEYTCKFNPERRMCFTCKHYEPKKEITQTYPPDELALHEEMGLPLTFTTTVQYCAHFKMPLYEKPYFQECEYYEWYNNGDPIKPMPGSCIYWEPKEEKEN